MQSMKIIFFNVAGILPKTAGRLQIISLACQTHNSASYQFICRRHDDGVLRLSGYQQRQRVHRWHFVPDELLVVGSSSFLSKYVCLI
jgi:hypothetical protein